MCDIILSDTVHINMFLGFHCTVYISVSFIFVSCILHSNFGFLFFQVSVDINETGTFGEYLIYLIAFQLYHTIEDVKLSRGKFVTRV